MNATQAICASRHQNRTVHITYTEEDETVLLNECDDYTLTEYWGSGINGPWRVHMRDEED